MKLVNYNQVDPMFPSTFGSMFDKFFNESLGAVSRQFSPAVDIAEDESSYEIQVAVPGMKKQDFKVDLTDGRLTISGERKVEEKKEGKNFLSCETQFGSFSRSFYVPETVVVEQIQAVYESGILRLVLPMAEKKVNKASIEVK